MKTYKYYDNKKSCFYGGKWHFHVLFTCEAIDITEADKLFQQETGVNPIKASNVSCVTIPHKEVRTTKPYLQAL